MKSAKQKKVSKALDWYTDKIDLNQKDDFIAYLESNIWKDKDGRAIYEMKYEQNPSGTAHIWTAKASRNKKIVSTYVTLPWRFQIQGQEGVAMQGCDLFTAFRYRGLGIYETHDREAPDYFIGKGVAFEFAFPSPQAIKGHNKAGWKHIGYLERWVKVLKTELIYKKFVKVGIIAKVLGQITDMFLSIGAKDLKQKNTDYKTVIVDKCDDRFDQLWQEAAQEFQTLSVRSKDYINWKFKKFSKHNVILAITKDDKIYGYAVLEERDGFGAIADIFSFKKKECVDVLLCAICQYFREHNVYTISYKALEGNFYFEHLTSFGFKKRDAAQAFMGTKIDQDLSEEDIFQPNQWHLTFGDCDIKSVL